MEDKNQQIENLAWQIFQKRLGLTFKKNLTVEQKKSITDVPDYQQYRDEALKVYEHRQLKKEKAVFNKKYPIIDVPANGKPDWYKGAYTLAFMYTKYKGNFIVRGYLDEVEEYIKKNYTHYFYFKSMWHQGESRGYWEFWKKDVGISEPSKSRKTFKFKVYKSGREDGEFKIFKEFQFKRLPKRWIPEFDTL